MSNNTHINLIVVGKHISDNWNNTKNKCYAKEDWQSIKVDAIFFTQRAKIGVHETIHINIIGQYYLFFAKYLIL